MVYPLGALKRLRPREGVGAHVGARIIFYQPQLARVPDGIDGRHEGAASARLTIGIVDRGTQDIHVGAPQQPLKGQVPARLGAAWHGGESEVVTVEEAGGFLAPRLLLDETSHLLQRLDHRDLLVLVEIDDKTFREWIAE